MRQRNEGLSFTISLKPLLCKTLFKMGCSFFTDKDNIGFLCITNIVIGIIFGIVLMFLRKNRDKTDEYESVQRSTTINDEYAGFSPENIIQRNHLPRSTRLIGRSRQRNLRCTEPVYVNRRDDYLDPEFHERDPNYHKPIHCMEENSDRNQMGHYINVCTGKGQGNQNPLDDYLEQGEKSCK